MAATIPMLPADDPWSLAKARFLEDLEPSERQLFDNATLENIYLATNNANVQDAGSSKTRTVIRKLGPLISAIESYGSALDTFTQIAPLYLSPIWGSIRVLLVAARCHSKFYDKIVDTLSRIGDILPGFRDYERIYDRHKHQRLATALSDTYLDIINICTKLRQSLRSYQSSSFRRVLKPLSFGHEFEDAVEMFRRHKEKVREEAKICHMIEAAEQRNNELVLAATARRQRLLSKLSNVNCLYRHRRLRESRHEGTGVWLTVMQEYQQWEQLESSSVLCCYGIPGCGKSVLASSVLDGLVKTQSTIFYYCDYADKRTLHPSNIFGALSRQLLENIDPIPDELALRIEQSPHDEERLENPRDALKILIKTAQLCQAPLYIIFDGLDEASEQSQKDIYQGLKQLLIESPINLKLLITGREEASSQLKLPPSFWYRKILISSTAISHDIENYIRASTKNRISIGSLVIHDQNLEDLIVEMLIKGAQGMFLWVEFQLNDLCDAESDHGIKIVLQNLPKNLSETYNRLLDRIEGLERRDMIKRLFKWIVCARQPLHVDELREGIAFTLFDDEWSREKFPTDFKRLVRACSNLVIVDEGTQIVELAHYTVEQYLLKPDGNRFNFTMKEANIMAGEICVAYLNFSNFDTQITKYKDNANSELTVMGKLACRGPLVSYDHPGRVAVETWRSWRKLSPIPTGLDLVKFGPQPKPKMPNISNFALFQYAKSHWLFHTRNFVDETSNAHRSRQRRLFAELALNRNFLFEVRPWGEFNEEQRDTIFKEILGWALNANHKYLIETVWDMHDHREHSLGPYHVIRSDWSMLLLKHNIKVGSRQLSKNVLDDLKVLANDTSLTESSTPGWLCSKVISAAQKDWLGVIETSIELYNRSEYERGLILYLLLEASAHGALPTVKALQKTLNSEDVAQILLRNRAYVIEDGYQYFNPLETAVQAGHLNVVMYLVRNRYSAPNLLPDVGSYHSLFIVNIDAGNLSALECLLYLYVQRSDIELDATQVTDIITRSMRCNNAQMLETLLRYIADSASQETIFETLIEAIKSSELLIVELLLRYFHSGIGGCCMPLTLAAGQGNLDVVKLILQQNPNAARSSSASIIWRRTHIKNSADCFCIYLCPTPLYMACYYKHMDVIEVLLEHGASDSFPSPTNLTRLKVESINSLQVHINPILSCIEEAHSFRIPGYHSISLSVHWDTPIALISRNQDEVLRSALLRRARSVEFVNSFFDVGSSPEFSIVTDLLFNDSIGSLNVRNIARLVNGLIGKFSYDEGKLLSSLDGFNHLAEWFCWALDHDNQVLLAVISYLSQHQPHLLHRAMVLTVQRDTRHRVRPLLELGANISTFATISLMDRSIIDAAQSRADPEYDELRNFFIQQGIFAVKNDQKDIVAQIVNSSITYSEINNLSDDDYCLILAAAFNHDSRSKRNYLRDGYSFLLDKLFKIFAFPDPASKPIEDALAVAEANRAVDVSTKIRKAIELSGVALIARTSV